ncbi:MAG: DEAD/DEAH box helicase, partial [Planctomycetes bacterium]|nr:DEAD/DEAH box helicase [Planctomycetota bacterium]
MPSRDELASLYLDRLPFEPYPVQEEALLAWFAAEEGVLVCAPTGMGKTLIAEAALFEALSTGRVAYYTTPLIALTEQKFREMQDAAESWGFDRDQVGLVTGNRLVNADATVRVVVAEILLNRLLHREAFDFDDTAAVVMDEFHSFNDPERGIVWELSLALLPSHVRLLLLSATVGNTAEFLLWLRSAHGRKVQLVQSTERRVPLRYYWIGDKLLNEQIEDMADAETRRTPALLFCFNREQCWSVAEQLRGKSLLADGQQKELAAALDNHDWTKGAGPKLKQILLRGVGVHHAGLLPRYRRTVETLFQKKLLSVCVCTETLSAGINLPARSVVLTTLMKGPPGKKKLIDPSSAHQMFGRAGRPQFDTEGYVYVLAHEDDVKILRWKQQYDQIPEDTKDPQLIKAKKRLKKKAPTRRSTEQYWNEAQFEKLIAAPPARLSSRGPFPWRLLAYLLSLSPDVELLRTAMSKRLMDDKARAAGRRQLTRMLLSLWAGGYVTLDPPPPEENADDAQPQATDKPAGEEAAAPPSGTFGALLQEARVEMVATVKKPKPASASKDGEPQAPADAEGEGHTGYEPERAYPTETLERLLVFRSINPLYGDFLTNQLGVADRRERLQALESVLDLPG